ncbi:MAG: hypothetical protein KF757_13820 [Phycisphaeraceae bacterium]|nr:hypothetical protein [Phycisphaeraceae bacterium]
MHRIRTTVIVAALTIPFVASTATADTVFHTWIEAPAEVMVGDTFTISVWTSLHGSVLHQGNVAFAGFQLHLTSSGIQVEFSEPFDFGVPEYDVGTPADGSVFNIGGYQWWHTPWNELNWENPIRLFSANVLVGAAQSGTLSIEPTLWASLPWMTGWYLDVPNSQGIRDDDPGSTRIITPATIRVIPTPASAMVLAFGSFAFACCRR